MVICWRCGVVFDDSDYYPVAPCRDCQMAISNDLKLLPEGTKRGRLDSVHSYLLEESVRALYLRGMHDYDIARRLKISPSAARRRRIKLGFPPQPNPEKYLWKDKAAQTEHIINAQRLRKQRVRGKNYSPSKRT